MVKLSGFADEIAADAKTQIATLNKTGVRHIEIRGVEGKGVLDLTADEVASFRGQLQEADIRVSSIGSPIGKVQIRADLEAHFARFEIALQRAREFAAPYVRVFSFYHKNEEAAACRDEVLAFFQRMVARAEAEGLVLLHENESGIFGDVPQRCADLLQSIDSLYLRATFDPSNFISCGADPLQEGWPLLREYTDYFHIKDQLAETRRVVPAGCGDGGLPQILAQAVELGFTGFLSIEPHLKVDDPEYGGSGAERFTHAVDGLRRVLSGAGIAED